jgi:hypothetical protein
VNTAARSFDQLMQAAAKAAAAGDLVALQGLLERAAAADPQASEPRLRLGNLFRRRGELEAAEAAYRAALALAPDDMDLQRLLGVVLLGQGRLEEGFALYEARHALPGMAKPGLPFSEWRGEPLGGKRLLIWPEHGLGDQIMFARFAPLLAGRGADVTLLSHPALARLFQNRLGVRTLAAKGAVAFPDPDFWVMSHSLSWRTGVTTETISAAPYLRTAGARSFESGFRVGVVTRGDPNHMNDASRSLAPADAERLRGMAGVALSLHPDDTGARDFEETAALVEGLDLVICVDTSVAHLAGAMGKPCWVLLPASDTDWRWMRGRRDTPWYDTVRLYRQAAPGDWGPVLDEVERDLRAHTKNQAR